MNAPKLLPWFARKAGVSDASALQLWLRASGEAEILCARAQSSDRYATALDRFLSLIEPQSRSATDGHAVTLTARQRPAQQQNNTSHA